MGTVISDCENSYCVKQYEQTIHMFHMSAAIMYFHSRYYYDQLLQVRGNWKISINNDFEIQEKVQNLKEM